MHALCCAFVFALYFAPPSHHAVSLGEASEAPRYAGSDSDDGEDEDEDTTVCEHCNDGSSTSHNPIVLCDGCDLGFHKRCHHIDVIPEGAVRAVKVWFTHVTLLLHVCVEHNQTQGISISKACGAATSASMSGATTSIIYPKRPYGGREGGRR